MAVNLRRLLPLQQMRASRRALASYLTLDGGRTLILAAVAFALMSLLTLAQTGRSATLGQELAELEVQRAVLLRERGDLSLQLADAQAFRGIADRAAADGLRPATRDQLRYIDLSEADPTPIPLVTP